MSKTQIYEANRTLFTHEDENGMRTFYATIFKCRKCGYNTDDVYTAGVINDLSGECPNCGADAAIDEYGEWTTDHRWYTE